MSVFYIIIAQQGDREDNTWSTLVVSKEYYDAITETLNNGELDRLDEVLESYNPDDIIADGVCKETAMNVAQEYSDEHLVTLIAVVPMIP